MNSENIKKVTNQAIEQLVEALSAGNSKALNWYLGAIAKFRAYSFLNVLLILEACPTASRVPGYKTWQSFGRQVKRGEKSIEDGRVVSGFRPVWAWERLSYDL
jgi:antirestriction factor ArdC-like protein